MATTRYKAERFLEEMQKRIDELLLQGSISPDDVTFSISVNIEESVRYAPKEQ